MPPQRALHSSWHRICVNVPLHAGWVCGVVSGRLSSSTFKMSILFHAPTLFPGRAISKKRSLKLPGLVQMPLFCDPSLICHQWSLCGRHRCGCLFFPWDCDPALQGLFLLVFVLIVLSTTSAVIKSHHGIVQLGPCLSRPWLRGQRKMGGKLSRSGVPWYNISKLAGF